MILMAGVATASASLLTLDSAVKGLQGFGSVAETKAVHHALDNVAPGKPQTVLLIGSDHRVADGTTDKPRSDTLMLVRLDGQKHATAVMSIPRDTKVLIPASAGMLAHDGKINEAFHDGGAPLTLKVLRSLLHIPINHVVVINFDAFSKAVNKLGCLYQDIDRRYFNDNSQGGTPYAVINVQAGYQKLCGLDTLSWVRFRHQDSDFIRAARQQEFLRSAKGQIAASKIIDNRGSLLSIFKAYTQTDIHGVAGVLGLLKLALEASSQPVNSIKFPGYNSPDPTDTYVYITPANLTAMVRKFQAVQASAPTSVGSPTSKATEKAQSKAKKKAKKLGLAPGLIPVAKPSAGNDAFLLNVAFQATFPVYYPSAQLASGGYATDNPTRVYKIATRVPGKKYAAYRLVIFAGINGEYYGIQGTKWQNAPILKEAHHFVKRGGRTLLVYPAGKSYRLVAWRTPNAVYWVSNTLSQNLSNRQMLDIASSLKRVGT
jgi:LCP family protein required for cell wall assembly